MAIIKQFPKQSRFTKAQSAPNRFAKTESAPNRFAKTEPAPNRFAKTEPAPNRFAKTESNLNTRVNLLLGGLTFTALASFAIVQLAPSDYAAQNQIQGSESAFEESEFNGQQLDDINSITNNTMMMDDHYNY